MDDAQTSQTPDLHRITPLSVSRFLGTKGFGSYIRRNALSAFGGFRISAAYPPGFAVDIFWRPGDDMDNASDSEVEIERKAVIEAYAEAFDSSPQGYAAILSDDHTCLYVTRPKPAAKPKEGHRDE
jgi:hypothetical protein